MDSNDESTMSAFSGVEIMLLFHSTTSVCEEENHVAFRNLPPKLQEVAALLQKCEYLTVLKHCAVQDFLKKFSSEDRELESIGHWDDAIQKHLNAYLDITADSKDDELLLLFVGVSALQLFVQCNWTGPLISDSILDILPFLTAFLDCKENSHKFAVSHLSVEQEKAYELVHYPELLLLSRCLLVGSSVYFKHCFSVSWWICRCLIIHQQILTDRSPTIHSRLKNELANFSKIDKILENSKDNIARVQFHVEAARFMLQYHEVLVARNYLETAQNLLGLKVELSGSLGKRTRFQQKAISQLLVLVNANKNETGVRISADQDAYFVPVDVKLDDDTLLNKPEYVSDDDAVPPNLFPEEQAIVLALCQEIKRSQADHPLIHEELMAYVEKLLNQPSVWSIHIQCLLMRCKFEKRSTRRVERSLKQLQVLIDSFRNEKPAARHRLYMFYSVLFPTVWEVEKELADLLISLGDVKSALEIYTRLELWEDIAKCYVHLQRKDKAEAIIRKRLEVEESPLMWCLLGDVTDDISHYMTAWELSGCKSARAQRSLGMFYYKKQDYHTCIPYFQASLEINSLQAPLWFSLAYAAMQIKDYKLCATAYRRVVNLDPDNFEAWNNLSNAYIKTKQKQRAWYALQEALKCNYEDWRIWENYLVVSSDVGAFDESIRAWHRIIDTKGKYLDDEILAILVKAITSDVADIYGEPASKFRKRLLELMGRITSTATCSAQCWRLYAQLYLSDPSAKDNPVLMQKVAQYLQKAHRCSTQQTGWEKDSSKCKDVLQNTKELADIYLTCADYFTGAEVAKMLSSAKLSVHNVLTTVSVHAEEFASSDTDYIKGLVNDLELKLERITAKLTQSGEVK